MDCQNKNFVFTILCNAGNWSIQQIQFIAFGAAFSIASAIYKYRGEKEMFEKQNEVDEKIGDVGHVKVDITPELKIVADLGMGVKKDLLPKVPGGLDIEANLSIKLNGDPAAIGLFYLGQSNSAPMAWIAQQLAKLKAGEAVHPAIEAAVAAAPAAVTPEIPGN